MAPILSHEQFEHYREHGWLLLHDDLELSVDELRAEVEAIASWDGLGEWLHHFEMTEYGPKLARTENFTPYCARMRQLLRDGAMSRVAAALLGEEALLYKEEINYKPAGGGGFAPHQDQPAYPFVDNVLSVMVAVDDATIENGCLHVASGWHHEVLEQDGRGCLAEEVVAQLEWQPMPLRAGETLFFHALTPHRSGPNRSNSDRRALYPTYNGASDGDLRDAYYRTKRRAFESPDMGGRVRLSLIGDFEGRPA